MSENSKLGISEFRERRFAMEIQEIKEMEDLIIKILNKKQSLDQSFSAYLVLKEKYSSTGTSERKAEIFEKTLDVLTNLNPSITWQA